MVRPFVPLGNVAKSTSAPGAICDKTVTYGNINRVDLQFTKCYTQAMSRINRRREEQKWARTAASVGDLLASAVLVKVPRRLPALAPPPAPAVPRPRPKRCRRCAAVLKSGAPRPQGGGKRRLYCSAKCRVAAWRSREADQAGRVPANGPGLRDDQVVELGVPLEVVEELPFD